MIITQTIKIDFTRPAVPECVSAVQGEDGTRVVRIELYAAGAPWQLPAGHDVSIRYGKPDGTNGSYDTLPDKSAAWSSEGNTVSVILCPQMLTCPGTVHAQVCITVGERLLSTFAFYVVVEADPSKGAVKSENYHNWRKAFLPQTEGAKVGQYLQITEVDAEGRVIKVMPVDAPSGGYGGGDLDMKGSMIDNVGTLAFAGPDGTAANGAWMAIDDVVESDNGVVSPVINHLSNDHDHPVIYRNIAPGVEDRDAATVGQLKTKLPAPPKAAIGQFLRVTAVDENGAVTAVEAVDAPSGGGGADEVFAKLEDGTVVPAEVEFDLSNRDTSVLVVAPPVAEIGQTIVVEEVNDKGVPTKWKAVDLPAGGSGGVTWETIIDYTVPEDCAQVLLKTDLNGNPFKLKEAIATFLLFPATDVTAAVAVRYTVDGSITNTVYSVEHYAHGAPTTPTAAGKCTVFKIHVLDTPFGVHLIEAAQAKDANYSQNAQLGVRPVDVYDPFNSSTLMQKVAEISGAGVGGVGAAIGAGSRIIMVGVRE